LKEKIKIHHNLRIYILNYMKGYANSFSSKELNLTKKAVIFWLDSHEDETNLIEMNDKWDMIKLFKKIEKWNGNSNNVIKKKNPITEKSSNITDKNSNEEKKKNKGKSRIRYS